VPAARQVILGESLANHLAPRRGAICQSAGTSPPRRAQIADALGPAPTYVAQIADAARRQLAERLRESLGSGLIRLRARAWAALGRRA